MTPSTLRARADAPATLEALRMPAHVERMPLSWYCPIRGRDVVTGYRVWDGSPFLEYGQAVAIVEPHGGGYRLLQRDPDAGWIQCNVFHGEGSRQRAIDCAEHYETECFNRWQPDPRDAKEVLP